MFSEQNRSKDFLAWRLFIQRRTLLLLSIAMYSTTVCNPPKSTEIHLPKPIVHVLVFVLFVLFVLLVLPPLQMIHCNLPILLVYHRAVPHNVLSCLHYTKDVIS